MEKFIPKPYKEDPVEGTTRIDINNVLRIFPTPTNGTLNVEIFGSISHLYLSDMTGKVMQNFDFETTGAGNKNFAIEMGGYATGIYFINAFYEGR
jgi:hypothetical protein